MYVKISRLSRIWLGFSLCFVMLYASFVPNAIGYAAQTSADCPGTQASRLIIGSFAVVTPGAPNNVRGGPSTKAEIVTQVYPGETVYVLDHPTCAESYAWWPVKTLSGFKGWTAESSATSYFLAPTSSAIEKFSLVPGAGNVRANYKGASFTFPATLGAIVEAKTVFEVRRQPDSLSDDYPQHIEFALGGINPNNLYNTATLDIYKTAAIVAHGTDTATFESFRQLLSAHPDVAGGEPISVYPSVHAGQIIVARMGYLPFQAGSGIRFVTHYAQSVEPLTGDRLIYTYLGLTDDGKNYVIAQIPVKTPILIGNEAQMPDLNEPQITTLYTAYVKQTDAKLNKAKASDFVPNLDDLDKLVNSLSIQ